MAEVKAGDLDEAVDVEESIMKIAVTSQGTELSSPVDPRFGRAKYFLIFDTETDAAEVCDNDQNLNAPQGAGIQAARAVVEQGAQAVITGNVGPKAFATLQAAGVDVFTQATGTVRQALDHWRIRKLKAAGKANVEGHWV